MVVTTRSPTTVISNTGWTGPENTFASDTLRATVTTAGTTNFVVGGFGLAALIGTDDVNSVTIRTQHFEDRATQNRMYVDLLDNGVVLAGGQEIVTRTAEGYDQVVLTGITAAQINSLQLRVEGAKRGGGGSRTFNVNHLEISIDHTPPPPPPEPNPSINLISENFNATPAGLWGSYGFFSHVDGAMRVDFTTPNQYSGYEEYELRNAINSEITTRITRAMGGITSGEVYVGIRSNATNNSRITIGWNPTGVTCRVMTSGITNYQQNLATSDEPSTTGLKIAITATEVIFSKKPIGSEWVELGRTPIPTWDLNSVWAIVTAGFFSTVDPITDSEYVLIHGYNADVEVSAPPSTVFPWRGLGTTRPWRGLGTDIFKGL